MDCHTALDLLEIVRPNSSDLEEAELASAAAHLESCRQCQSIFRNQQNEDIHIGRALRNVAVPSNLKGRILEGLAAPSLEKGSGSEAEYHEYQPAECSSMVHEDGDAPEQSLVAADEFSSDGTSRRKWLQVSFSAAVCVLIGLLAWYLRPSTPETYTLRQLEEHIVFQPDGLPKFDRNFAAPLPDPKPSWKLLVVGEPRGQQLGGAGQHTLALYFLAWNPPRHPPVQGVLMVLPKTRLQKPPAQTSFKDGTFRYSASGNLPYVAWTSNDLVYVCWLKGGPDVMEQLQQEFHINPA